MSNRIASPRYHSISGTRSADHESSSGPATPEAARPSSTHALINAIGASPFAVMSAPPTERGDRQHTVSAPDELPEVSRPDTVAHATTSKD
jgi:hypothetical protein